MFKNQYSYMSLAARLRQEVYVHMLDPFSLAPISQILVLADGRHQPIHLFWVTISQSNQEAVCNFKTIRQICVNLKQIRDTKNEHIQMKSYIFRKDLRRRKNWLLDGKMLKVAERRQLLCFIMLSILKGDCFYFNALHS